MPRSGYRNLIVLSALLLLPLAAFAQDGEPDMSHDNTLSPKPMGSTPRTPDGHPDLTGLWNGLGDNLLGVPNQMYNAGIEVGTDGTTRDVNSGISIATWPIVDRTGTGSFLPCGA